MTERRRAISGLAGTLAFALTACDAATATPADPGGEGFPTIATLPDIDGDDVAIRAGAEDEVFVLTFWATWCQPCQSEMLKIDAMAAERAGTALRLYGVSIDGPDTAAQVPAWTRREGYRFPVLLDRETEVLGRYHPKGDIPFYVVLDARGTVLKSHQGYNDGDVAELAEYLDGLLGR